MRFDLEKQDDVYLISRQDSFMHADVSTSPMSDVPHSSYTYKGAGKTNLPARLIVCFVCLAHF